MEILLAIVVASAVVFFGALISMGNERQRKAIDELQEQFHLWAVEDLRVKREKLAHDVSVSDPLAWLNKVVTKVSGVDWALQYVEIFHESQTLLCSSENQDKKVLLSLFSPKEIQRMKHRQRKLLSRFWNNNPLLSMPRGVLTYEISVLNAGILFDLEFQLAWKALLGKNSNNAERLWLYMI